MHEKLGKLSTQQQICADIVFTALLASLKNYENRQNGKDEELSKFFDFINYQESYHIELTEKLP